MKNKGKPANANISVYGIRKAPEGRRKKKTAHKTMNISVVTTVVVHSILPLFPASNNPLIVCFAFCRI